MKKILLGNEAIVRGALESGVEFVSAYPGTPSSEIGMIFGKIAKDNGIYFEFSTNEKVALEASIGASYSGMKCLVSMKNFGLNVASDSLMPFCYTGSKGPTVIVVADDPSCWSSGQSEQNTRAFADLAHIPILEPSDVQEAKDFTKLAFEISEKFKIPVILRTTTRIAHQRAPVEFGKIKSKKPRRSGQFIKDVNQFVTMPPRVLEMKDELLAKIEKIRDFSEKSLINRIDGGQGSGDYGVIVSGVSYLYVKEALRELKLDLPIFKIGIFNPLPNKKIKTFIKKFKNILIVEELEGFVEREVNVLAKEVNPKLKVLGKDVLPITRELNVEKVIFAFSKLLNKKFNIPAYIASQSIAGKQNKISKRFPRLCVGCPYWLIFSAVKRIAPKGTIFGGGIGCYMLAGFPPHEIQDYLLDMGSSVGIAHGIKKNSNQKLITFVGDSSFFHAGIPALINVVYNKSNPLIIIMDNRITAMTGHQPNPGMGKTGMEEDTEEINIEDIVKAVGVKNVKTLDPKNIKELESTIKTFIDKKEVSVIIAKRICAYWDRKLKNQKQPL
ncbi:MAG: thiamine pyrophosphate-dependent enzyme [Candidatus Nealsonbacteria bacterium]